MKILASRNSPRRVLENYLKGETTRTGLILETLQFPVEMLDEALAAFPEEVQEKLSSFLEVYTPETVIINGPRPPEGAIQYAREWLARCKVGRERSAPGEHQAPLQAPFVTDHADPGH